jgi:hypothetical protein
VVRFQDGRRASVEVARAAEAINAAEQVFLADGFFLFARCSIDANKVPRTSYCICVGSAKQVTPNSSQKGDNFFWQQAYVSRVGKRYSLSPKRRAMNEHRFYQTLIQQ